MTNVAELPAAREQLRPAGATLEFLMHHHAALIQRYAAQVHTHTQPILRSREKRPGLLHDAGEPASV